MIFNSIDFAVFLPVVFALYWFVPRKYLRVQNLLILFTSYLFYGWWDWRFLGLVLFSTVVDYIVAILLGETSKESHRKALLILSLAVNLGLLGFFKYYDFFIENFVTAFSILGKEISIRSLHIILPVGISFYTFQTLSYTIDVYRKKIEPTKDFIAFAAFISFFPQLVAGPIERAAHLLPQFFTNRTFNYNFAVTGVQLICWGLFKKIVIADNAAIIVDGIFREYGSQSSASLAIGIFLFAFQIYCDFSGYSDIAIGTGRLFGFDLKSNFNFPYFSENIREFWKRWHISLSTWFRDYVYIPLGGSKGSSSRTYLNIAIVFLISGLWHGANWTFVVWGSIHALLFFPVFIFSRKKVSEITSPNNLISTTINRLLTFAFVCLAWIFFRASSLEEAITYTVRLISFNNGEFFPVSTTKYIIITFISFLNIILLLIVEYVFFKKEVEVRLSKWLLLGIVLAICFMGAFKNHASFIYFQF